MQLTLESTVDQWIKANANHAKVFLKHGIECCHGKQMLTLHEVCEQHRLDCSRVIEELAMVANPSAEPVDVQGLSAPELAEYVRNQFHLHFAQLVCHLRPFTQKISRKHGAGDPVLGALEEAFAAFARELEAQLQQYEIDVFPAMRGEMADTESLTQTTQVMLDLARRQQRIADAMGRVKTATGGYAVSPESCNTYRAVMRSLSELDSSIEEYGRLQHAYLLPRFNNLSAEAFLRT